MSEIHVNPTSQRSADIVSAILLRDKDQRRLVLQAQLVHNDKESAAPIKCTLLWERKKPSEEWEPLEAINP
jgi:hypothetical protein